MEPEDEEPYPQKQPEQLPQTSQKPLRPQDINEQKIRSMTSEELLNYVYYIDIKNRQLKSRIAQLEPFKQRELRDPPLQKQESLFGKFLCKKYALKIAYIGVNYNGIAIQQSTDNTIQAYLFKCLYGLSLIKQRAPSSEYRRAGRTDKGVSSFGNVVSLMLRTSEQKEPTENIQTSIKDKRNGALNYAKMLNSILPNDIRILAYREVDDSFDARKDCMEREYKYFFVRGHLNMEAIEAGIGKFVGKHNFINFCKLDVTSTIDYQKTISKASIESVESDIINSNQQPRNRVFYFHFIGSSFLWHQIRYMSAILFLIGSGKESPEIIDELLDIQKCQSKPNYSAAPEYPLILEDCRYKNLQFEVHPEDAVSFYNTFNDIVMKKVIEMTLYINSMVLMKQWLFECVKITNEEFIGRANEVQKIELEKKARNKKMLKASGLNLQQCVGNLKGKNKQMYERVHQKRANYDRIKQLQNQSKPEQRIQDDHQQ